MNFNLRCKEAELCWRTHSCLVWKGICILWKCSSCWAAPSHKGALALPILSQLQKIKVTNRNVYFCLLEPPLPISDYWFGLDFWNQWGNLLLWRFALKPSAVRPTALSFVSITRGVLIVYSPRPPLPSPHLHTHSQTTILDERLSIHCNSSCLYNRCGSTDVYVLYSRVHFYDFQIKDCVEEALWIFFIGQWRQPDVSLTSTATQWREEGRYWFHHPKNHPQVKD